MALVDCSECGKSVSTQAAACPHCGAPGQGVTAVAPPVAPHKRSVAGKIAGLIVLLLIGGCVALFIQSLPPDPVRTASSPPPSGDDAAYFIWKYGPPDLDESTEHEVPRPKIVTRWLTYKKERVRMIYYPDAQPGSPPPYKGWKVMGALEGERDQNLSPDEIARRMAPRERHD